MSALHLLGVLVPVLPPHGTNQRGLFLWWMNHFESLCPLALVGRKSYAHFLRPGRRWCYIQRFVLNHCSETVE
jgi:hypothetical protein